LGDRYGRHKVLAMTMVMMAIGTFSIGLIPSYAQIGMAAPALLLCARLVQGFSTGGEYGGAATFVAEYSTDRRRGLMGSWLEFGTFGGYIAGAALVTGLQMSLGSQAMLAWGWRVPFLIAGPLGLLGLYMRMKLEETPAFKAYTDEAESRETVRLRDMISAHWRQLVKCVALVLVFNVTDYMLLTYMPNYLSVTLGYAESKGLLLIILVMLVLMPLNVLGGVFADRLGRRPMVIGACAALIVLAIPCMMLIGTGNDALIFLGLMVLGITLVCFTSTMPSTLPALFYTPVRYSALSIAFNISVSLFGGTTPLVTAWLVETTGDPLMPAYYMMGAALIGLGAMLTVKETAGMPCAARPGGGKQGRGPPTAGRGPSGDRRPRFARYHPAADARRHPITAARQARLTPSGQIHGEAAHQRLAIGAQQAAGSFGRPFAGPLAHIRQDGDRAGRAGIEADIARMIDARPGAVAAEQIGPARLLHAGRLAFRRPLGPNAQPAAALSLGQLSSGPNPSQRSFASGAAIVARMPTKGR
jgi:MFS family permease